MVSAGVEMRAYFKEFRDLAKESDDKKAQWKTSAKNADCLIDKGGHQIRAIAESGS